ncbi:MAG TPA: low temperature requirement protein A [Candidatus Limnocylindria bacterium]|nr:low temperature requirement protein A [Candidatus Limnocylindria bacterium]
MGAEREARTPESGQRVTNLELFFDLVFVFAITQVTGFLSADPTWSGLLHGLLLLAVLWWAWAAYAWLTNTLNPEEGGVRLMVFCSIGAMLVVSLAVPDAFGRDGIIFGLAYFVVRALHLALYALAGRGDKELLRAVLRTVPSAILGPLVLVIAAFADGPAELLLWGLALLIDYGGVLLGGMRGWRVSPEHFIERHGLVLIIALGESIVAIGVGAAGLPLDAGVLGAALLGMVVIAALWWFFDWVIFVAQSRLTELTGARRAILARDLYSCLHLPMVAGIVLFALGLKTTLHDVAHPLSIIPAIGLCGGLALYMAAHVAGRLRMGGGLGHGRPMATVALSALVPVAVVLPALASLSLVALACAALIAYEALRYRYARSWQPARLLHNRGGPARGPSGGRRATALNGALGVA